MGNTTRTINPDFFMNENLVEVVKGANLFLNQDWSNASGTITVDGSSTLTLQSSFTTADLGLVDNTAGGTVNIQATLDNTGDTLALDATTGSYTLNGGTIQGGTITEAAGSFYALLLTTTIVLMELP